jgi:hypothetical protein
MATNPAARDWPCLAEPAPAPDVQQTHSLSTELERYGSYLRKLEPQLASALDQLALDVKWEAAEDLGPDGIALLCGDDFVSIPLLDLMNLALSLAQQRRQADSPPDVRRANASEAAGELEKLAAALEAAERCAKAASLDAWRAVPHEMCALPGWSEEWAPALRGAAQRLRSGSRKGRPRSEGAMVATLAARHYAQFAHRLPRVSGTGANPLYRYVARLFGVLDVKGSAKKHVDRAVRTLHEST